MTRDRMYQERAGNISVFRGCGFGCTYCAFRNALRRSSCEKCGTFEPHAHLEVLNKRPPKTKEGEFLTIGLTGDISFASDTTMQAIIHYCWLWAKHTFLIQSKDPSFFLGYEFPENVILGTTIETNCNQIGISKAPSTRSRADAMVRLNNCKKMITIEPIMQFDMNTLPLWMRSISPEFIYVGYNSKDDIKLSEPSLEKTQLLIEKLSEFTEVRTKLMRKAWWEK